MLQSKMPNTQTTSSTSRPSAAAGCQALGHYLEYMWMTDEMWTRTGANSSRPLK